MESTIGFDFANNVGAIVAYVGADTNSMRGVAVAIWLVAAIAGLTCNISELSSTGTSKNSLSIFMIYVRLKKVLIQHN